MALDKIANKPPAKVATGTQQPTPQPVTIEAEAPAAPEPQAAPAQQTALVATAAQPVAAEALALFGAEAAGFAGALAELASSGLDLSDPNALNGSAEALGSSIPWLRIQQKRDDEQQLQVGRWTNTLTAQQMDSVRFVILDTKFQRQNRPKYIVGAEEQEPTRCWSANGRHATGEGSFFDEGGCWDGHDPSAHVCARCPHAKWTRGEDGKRHKECNDVHMLLEALLPDEADENASPEIIVFAARGSSVAPTEKLLKQRTALGYRYGGRLPQQIAGARSLTVGVEGKLVHAGRKGDYYFPVYTTFPVGLEQLPELMGLISATRQTFVDEVHVDRMPDEAEQAAEPIAVGSPSPASQPLGAAAPGWDPSWGPQGQAAPVAAAQPADVSGPWDRADDEPPHPADMAGQGGGAAPGTRQWGGGGGR